VEIQQNIFGSEVREYACLCERFAGEGNRATKKSIDSFHFCTELNPEEGSRTGITEVTDITEPGGRKA